MQRESCRDTIFSMDKLWAKVALCVKKTSDFWLFILQYPAIPSRQQKRRQKNGAGQSHKRRGKKPSVMEILSD